MSPPSGHRRRQTGLSISLHPRWMVLGLLAFNTALWALIIDAVRRVFG